jgi:serine/threonine-protein kinase
MGRRDAEPTVKRDAAKDPGKQVIDDAADTIADEDDASAVTPDAQAIRSVVSSVDESIPDSEGRVEELGDLGRYQILFRLARGGMGTVHVGRLRSAHRFDRFVAVKRLSMPTATEDDVQSFLAEARISAMISHPNVVQTLDVGEQQGVPFLVMPLVEGVSLDRLLRRIQRAAARLDPYMAAWIMLQAGRGLHAAHELQSVEGEPYGLVHRDFSPENVLLSFDGRVYVADFGVARFADPDRHTKSGVVKGKFAYMSPEQTEAEKLDRRSDVFSLGIVLHECLTGRPLFEGRSVADTIRRIWSLDPPNPADERPDIPRALGPIVRRCLLRERDRRYPTAAEVSDELRELMRKDGVVIDEADMARLLREYFPKERERLREKIRKAIRAADEGTLNTGMEDVERDEDDSSSIHGATGTEVTGSMTTGPPLEARRGSMLLFALIAALAVGAGVWLLRGPTGESAPVDEPTTQQATAGSSAPVASPPPSPSQAVPAPPPSSAPSTVIARPPPRAFIQPPSAPRPLPPSPAPTPKSHKGVPFKTVD